MRAGEGSGQAGAPILYYVFSAKLPGVAVFFSDRAPMRRAEREEQLMPWWLPARLRAFADLYREARCPGRPAADREARVSWFAGG